MAAGLVALQRYNVVDIAHAAAHRHGLRDCRGLLDCDGGDVAPFDPRTPLLGLSAVGLWIVVAAAVIPSPPT